MSKPNSRQPAQKPVSKSAVSKAAREIYNNPAATEFSIPYPMLLLALVSFLLYAISFSFNLTELDDSIFIRDFHEYNENLSNLVTSFQRGLFDAVKDPYYRPLFLDTMILNYHWSDQGQNLVSYHVLNVLLHIASVLLLYRLFIRLKVKKLHSFILALLFAVHPVLTQAVAWIPGRNDTMLAIFTLSFFLYAIEFTDHGKLKNLLLSTLFLILAFFTKETAVFAAPVAFILLVPVLGRNWRDKKLIMQYGVWIACFAIWYVARAAATVKTGIAAGRVLSEFFPRLPVIVQYFGKIFFPFNLSVFPTQQDTVYYYGIAAIVLFAVLIFFSKQKNYKIILGGLAIFILFLLPALLVPSNLNEQTFEHRLYLPIIGILLILPQTVLLSNNLKAKQVLTGGVVMAAIFAVITFMHQSAFADPVTFWRSAAETSPRSAYANMMLAARLKDDQESFRLFRKAYQLNPKEKYLNFYYGVMLQKQDSVLQSEKYLLTEKNTSGYYECDFYLARVAMEKKDPNSAISYLQTYLKADPANSQANNNLLLLFLDTQQPEKAKEQVNKMRKLGLAVPPVIIQKLGM